jgi:hypothetical protein
VSRIATLLLAPAVFFLPAASASAHFSVVYYSHSDSACTKRTDPITVVFYTSATAAHTLNHVQFHAGWSNTSGSTQYFQSHGVCSSQDGQRASGGLASSRYHIRVKKTFDADAVLGTTAVGTPHHEDLVVSCGHAVDKGGVGSGLVSGFDQGKLKIVAAFAGVHAAKAPTYWGNTETFKQCDGDLAGSNGYVRWYSIPNVDH